MPNVVKAGFVIGGSAGSGAMNFHGQIYPLPRRLISRCGRVMAPNNKIPQAVHTVGSLPRASPQSLIPLFPVWPDVGADYAALGADHAGTEVAHEELARVHIDVDNHLVPAETHDLK
jgi:hypothetical protein